MCFEIDSRKKAHRRTVVYKVVRVSKRGTMRSLTTDAVYTPGRTKKRSKGNTSYLPYCGHRQAGHGIYIIDTLKNARIYGRSYVGGCKIVKCKVKPEHFLHASVTGPDDNGCMTYEQVTPTSKTYKI